MAKSQVGCRLGAGVLFLALELTAGSAWAAEIHAAPEGTGDGSAASAAASVDAALAQATPGDVVLLHEGYYGDLALAGRFDSQISVEAAEGESVKARTLTVRDAENLTVKGLSISLSHAESYSTDTMVSVEGGSSGVTVSDCDIFSVPDSEISDWSASDWAELPGTAVSVRSPDSVIWGNRIRNVGYGISINYDAPRATVSHNHIQNFSRDGLRGIADDGVFEYNTVLDAYDVDDHHDDFFQSWSYEDGVVGTTVVRGVVLRGNLFVNFTDPDRPFAGSAQGIGCFDGFFEDWIVENNVVIVNHWHGITFLGARNMRIVNNTVLDNALDEEPGPPWINVSAHKDGRASSDILLRNNLTSDITLEAENSTEDHNLIFSDPAAVFVDHEAFDLHLKSGAEAIDAGSDEEAPLLDRDRIPRPQGAGFDVGAFEWHDGSVQPEGSVPGIEAETGVTEPPSAAERPGGGGEMGGAPGEGSSEAASGDESGCGCRQGPGEANQAGGTRAAVVFILLAVSGVFVRRRNRWPSISVGEGGSPK